MVSFVASPSPTWNMGRPRHMEWFLGWPHADRLCALSDDFPDAVVVTVMTKR